jgi:hypothetical protein
MENNIIVFTVALPLTLSLLAIAVSFVVLVNNASVVVSKIVDSGLSVLFTKPVLRLLLISLLALSTIIICHVIKVRIIVVLLDIYIHSFT